MTDRRQQGTPTARSGEALSAPGATVRRHDRDRFLLCLFVPAARREAALTLAAFNHEIARAIEVPSRRAAFADESRLAAAIRLQWWRDVVEGAPRRHPVAEPLAALLDAGIVERGAALAMIEAREADLEGPASGPEAWWARLRDGPGQLARAIGRLSDLEGARLDWCAAAGAAYGAGALLRHRAALRAVGRHALPDGATDADTPALARVALARLAALPPFRAPRRARAAALHAVLARRDLARALGGAAETGAARSRPAGDTLAVLAAWATGRIPLGRAERTS